MGSFNVGAAIGSLLTGIGGGQSFLKTAGSVLTSGFGSTPAAAAAPAAIAASPASPFAPNAGAFMPSFPMIPAGLPAMAANGTQGGETSPWGPDRWLALGRRAHALYEGWRGEPIHPTIDIANPAHLDDMELAKMIAQHRAIPLQSDIGQLAARAGGRVRTRTVRLSNGSSMRLQVVELAGARSRVSRKNITSYRLGTAAWVMRRLKQQQKLGRRLASIACSLYPRKAAKAKGHKK